MNTIKNTISDIETLFGKGYVKLNPQVVAAIITADAINNLTNALHLIHGEMNQFNPQIERLGSSIEDIALSIDRVAEAL